MYKFVYVYICTGVYTRMFDGFVKSLDNFCYEDDVIHEVKLLTDDINFDYQKYETEKIKIHPYYIKLQILCQRNFWKINDLYTEK